VFFVFIIILYNKNKVFFFIFIFLFIWMQVWSLEKEDTPHFFSSRVFFHYYKFFLKKIYSLFGFFIFVNFFLLYFPFLVSFVSILFL